MVRGLPTSLVRRHGLALTFLGLLATEASAGSSVQNIGLYDGGNAPVVEIQYTGNSGVWVYGDPQTATNWTNPNGSYIPLYCIDLQHDNYLGSSYQLTTWTDPNSFIPDAINRVAWAIENTPLSGYGPAATQFVIWTEIDPNFSVINWSGNTGPGSLEAAYDALESNMSASYDPEQSYLTGVSFFDAVHAPASYLNQDICAGTQRRNHRAIRARARQRRERLLRRYKSRDFSVVAAAS
jgi:hypothetical protein